MGNRNSGRRPAPTALKILRGNPSRRRLAREPVPPAGEVDKPAGLSPGASAVWDVLAPVARTMGTLTRADRWAFVTLCELQATFDQVVTAKAAAGYLPVSRSEDGTGETVWKVHPLIRLERETAAAVRPYYEAFGLHPSARARIVAPGSSSAAPASVSKWA